MQVLEPGSALGRYELLLPVAQGGQATVWAARLTGLAGFERIVALKTLLPPRRGDESDVERFTDEALLATELRHPNVVEVLDFGEHSGVLYLVMPWIDGEPLSVIIDETAKRGGVPLPIASNLIGQVCRGLHAAHELRDHDGIPLELVHRDVSPENVLVTRDGTAKITDFGVATIHEPVGHGPGVPEGHARGKVLYMAPEELWGDPVDRRADVFALSVILYRLTASRYPFGTGQNGEPARRLLDGPVPSPASVAPGYPPALEAVVLQGLAEQPADRFRTATELRKALFRAVPPASDDEVAAFFADLFPERRARRDRLLRAAIERRATMQRAPASSSARAPFGFDRSRLNSAPAVALGLVMAMFAAGALGSALFAPVPGSADSGAPPSRLADGTPEPPANAVAEIVETQATPEDFAAHGGEDESEPASDPPAAGDPPATPSIATSPVRDVGF